MATQLASAILTFGLIVVGATQAATAVLVSRHIASMEKRLFRLQKLALKHESEFESISALADEEE